jgi:UDP-2,4-diacetamido-2,4,6-trideoxy-beta-L-altropyranose hydrolase
MHLKKKIAFFVNFNRRIGLGHIHRCISLANVLSKKIEIIFFINKKFFNLKYYSYVYIDNNKTLKKINNFLKINKYKNIIFDLDNKRNSKKKLLNIYNFFIKKNYNTICWDNLYNLKCKFDYVYRPYPKKIFTNPKKITYKKITGTKFFFSKKINKKFYFREKIKIVGVQLGGTDNLEIIKNIYNYLSTNKKFIKIYFFVTHSKEIKYLNSKKKIKIFKNNNFSNYVQYIDLLITSGGMTKYESSSLKLPSLAICLNKIQYNLNKNLNYKYGFLICKKINIIKTLDLIFNNKNIRFKLYRNAKKNFKNFDNSSVKKMYSILK